MNWANQIYNEVKRIFGFESDLTESEMHDKLTQQKPVEKQIKKATKAERESLESLQAQFNDLQTKFDELNTRFTELQDAITAKDAKIAELEAKIEAAEAEKTAAIEAAVAEAKKEQSAEIARLATEVNRLKVGGAKENDLGGDDHAVKIIPGGSDHKMSITSDALKRLVGKNN